VVFDLSFQRMWTFGNFRHDLSKLRAITINFDR